MGLFGSVEDWNDFFQIVAEADPYHLHGGDVPVVRGVGGLLLHHRDQHGGPLPGGAHLRLPVPARLGTAPRHHHAAIPRYYRLKVLLY